MAIPRGFTGLRRRLGILAAAGLLLAGGAVAAAPVAAAHGWYDVCPSGCAFSAIQAAVNAAPDGGLVTVGPGTYGGMVSVEGKRITLIGAGASTIIDASGQRNGILIGAPFSGGATAGTRIANLVVEYAEQAGILAMSTSALSITGTTVRANDQATPAGATAEHNPDYEALHLMAVTNSLVAWNFVAYNKDGGIYLTNEFGAATGNRVIGNTSLDNAVDCGITLAAHVPGPGVTGGNAGVSYNDVLDNVSIGNGAAGVIIATPVPTGVATGNRVIGNTIRGNSAGGINIHGHAPDENLANNQIIGNTISGNGPDYGSTFKPTGISLSGQGGAVIARPLVIGNRITDEYYGIALAGVANPALLGNVIAATVPIYWY